LWTVPANDISTPIRREITRFDDERLKSLDVLRPHIVETLRHLHPKVLEQYNISVGLTGPFSQVAFMMGVEGVLTAMTDQPEELKAAVQLRVPFAITWAEQVAEMGAPSVWIGEGVASGSMISAAHYVNFVLPFEQQVTAKLLELGIPVALHICGKADNLLAEMVRSGTDCLEIDWQVDLEAAKACVGSQVSLKGNLHTTRVALATPSEIYEDACRAIKAAKPGGGFILSSGCALGRDTPPENVAAMARAPSDFGIY
jgi:MtaA/CmuA family methyltransferase